MTWLIEDKTRIQRFRRGEPGILRELHRRYALQLARDLVQGLNFRFGSKSIPFRAPSDPYALNHLVETIMRAAFRSDQRQAYTGLESFSAYLRRVTERALCVRYQAHLEEAQLFSSEDPGESRPSVADQRLLKTLEPLLEPVPEIDSDCALRKRIYRRLTKL